jgi:hypothetical protein
LELLDLSGKRVESTTTRSVFDYNVVFIFEKRLVRSEGVNLAVVPTKWWGSELRRYSERWWCEWR